ncbi:NYN domain-containing protein [Curtobacterium sp. VKM Ac-2922]|uniref:NYN domain-containing protein n=1 Tax=Curtobacterium sp. VKM Ac-2922 TaxID=2929475 RepID=UPI001FB1DCE2|nr:NYN domain-containing protein [Curtobacterium sp. VKM Ac-2922]MCJ1715913.1 NYN domain-containing protein [Curtobacterium sp. VKM Ac-2922]
MTEIAKSGKTGQSTGPHVHIETRINGTSKAPLTQLHFRWSQRVCAANTTCSVPQCVVRQDRAMVPFPLRSDRPTAFVYVDGFNLFRRALQGHHDRNWLDLELLCERLLPTFDAGQIRYFTARVRHVEGRDPRSPQHQEAYLRALGTLPSVSVHFGTFRADKRWMAVSPLELDDDGAPKRVRVRKIEEKGTDVSLAAHMVADAMSGSADAYLLLSNDSDFVDALRLVRERTRHEIGLIVPTENAPARTLLEVRPDHLRHVRPATIRDSQFPDRLVDELGGFARPRSWRNAGAPLGERGS